MDKARLQKTDALSKASVFSHLCPGTLEQLAGGSSPFSFRRGNVVFCHGDRASGMYVVVAGQLKLTQETRDGAEHVVELLQVGDSFGEAELLTDRPYLVTASAVNDCKLLHIRREAMMSGLERDPELARRVIARLSDCLYRQTGEIENVLLLSATGRVARFIFNRLLPSDFRSVRRVALPFRKCLIASHLNMTPEHFSRTLRDLTTFGLIRVSGVMVDIIEVDKLRDAAGLAPGVQFTAAVA